MRKLVVPSVLISVIVLSTLLTPLLRAEASLGGERIIIDLELPSCTLSFELPQGYRVANRMVEGLPVYRTQTHAGESRVFDWGTEALSYSARGVLVGTDQHPADPGALLKEEPDAAWEAVAFQEGPVDVMGEGDAIYPGYYVLVHKPAEPGQHGMFASTEGHLMVLLESTGVGAVHFTVSFLDTEDHTINGDTITFTIDGQSPITKHKADVASVVASVRISWQPQEPSQIPATPAVETVPPEEPKLVEVSQAQGEVYIREDASFYWAEVSPASGVVLISVGSAVRTGRGSVCLRNISGQGDQVFVGENTEVHIGERVTKLDVLIGKIRVWIEKLGPETNIEVDTPYCGTSVRGTDFIMDTNQDRTEVLVFEGTVELSDLERQKTVLVEAGEFSVVTSGGLPSEPQRYSNVDVYQKYQSLFESEDEIKAVVGDIEELVENRESGGFPFYLLPIPAVAIAVIIIILMMRRRRRA